MTPGEKLAIGALAVGVLNLALNVYVQAFGWGKLAGEFKEFKKNVEEKLARLDAAVFVPASQRKG